MSRAATDWAWSIDLGKAPLKLILLSMADRADEEHLCYPSIDRLVRDTSLNKKTVQAGINELAKLGLIKDTGERKGPTRRVRVFQLMLNSKSPQKRNHTENGNVPENGFLNVPENGFLNVPENGLQNRSLEPVIEPKAIVGKPDTTAQAQMVIDHLNQTTGRKFTNSPSNRKFINARLADGHALSDLIDVIDRKAAEWLGDPKMEQYLRPATLFNAEKFEGYLNSVGKPLPVRAASAAGPNWDDTSWAQDLDGGLI